jgi:mono/diheme cytochrome c family protein
MSEQRRCAMIPCAALVSSLILPGAVLIEMPALANTAGILNATPLNTVDGREIYEHVCRGCHMPGAVGAVGAGRYPALAKDATLVSSQYMALTILKGRRNMPPFGAKHAIGFGGPPAVLSEAQIAAVINYVRSHFGNHYKDLITEAEIRALDQSVP